MASPKVGRPALERQNGKTSDALWREIEETRKALGKTQAAMAAVLGITRGAYSGQMSSGVPPTKEVWGRFSQWRREQGEWSLYKEEGWALVWDAGAESFVPMRLPYLTKVCANKLSACPKHNMVFIPRVKRQRFCCADCRKDFYKQRGKKADSVAGL